MRYISTLRLLALLATVSVPLVGATNQTLIHIEVDDIETMGYLQESAPASMTKEQADQACARGKAHELSFL